MNLLSPIKFNGTSDKQYPSNIPIVFSYLRAHLLLVGQHKSIPPADGERVQGSDFYFARQYDEALRHLNKSSTLVANYPFAAFFKGMCYIAKGNYAEGIKQE